MNFQVGDYVKVTAGACKDYKGVVREPKSKWAITILLDKEWSWFRGTDGRQGYLTYGSDKLELIPKPKPSKSKSRMEDLIL